MEVKVEEVFFSNDEKEKGRAILKQLEGVRIAPALILLEKCKSALLYSKVDLN